MPRHLYLILLSTFFVGFLTGVYVFFTGWFPFLGTASESDRVSGMNGNFSIVADEYGGCTEAGRCQSYRIAEDGTYLFINRLQEQNARFDGRLDSGRMARITEYLEDVDLADITASTRPDDCSVQFGGIEYRYEIMYDGVRHVVDTCVHDVGDSFLFQDLEDLFIDFVVEHSE